MKRETTVCIIGAGVAGGIVAKELAARGVDFIVVEAGPHVPMRDKRRFLDSFTAHVDPFRDCYYEQDEYVNEGDLTFELRGNFVRARGGSTLAWGGTSLRLKPEDFRLRSNTGRGADWPIDYDELEPFYAVAERTLQVPGNAAEPGHPPRSGPFPLPAASPDPSDGPFLQAMRSLGYSTQSSSVAINTESINGRPRCETANHCVYCPIGARFTADQLFDDVPAARTLFNAPAVGLRMEPKRRAVTLEVIDRETGTRIEIEAATFVVCGGGIESPKLLLASQSAEWRRGIGNDAALVGRYLTNHLRYSATGHSRAARSRSLVGGLFYATSQSREFDSAAHQRLGKFRLGYQGGVVGDLGELSRRLSEGARSAEVAKALDEAARFSELGCELEQLPTLENSVELGRGVDRLGMPKTKIRLATSEIDRASVARSRGIVGQIMAAMGVDDVKWSELHVMAHPMCTTRMADDPKEGVVDRDLRVHGTDNLYVCGSSAFTTAGVANPTLTIAALAHRLGRHLAQRLAAH